MDFIQTESELDRLAERLAGQPLLAIDTEAAGFHRYHDRICLVQVSTSDWTAVIDALVLPDLAPLSAPLADPDIEIVLHDAEYDLRLLARDHDISVQRLFDTKIAAQFLGEARYGLADLVEKYLGIRMDKKHQRADWAHRPLAPELLRYAGEDTRHLPALRDRLRGALLEQGRMSWAEEEFDRRTRVRWNAADNEEAFRKLKNIRDLNPLQLAALREVHAWREDLARSRDVAPFRVAPNELLVEVARALPASASRLRTVPGASPTLIGRYGDALLDAVRRARALPADQLPVRRRGARRPPPDPDFDDRVERLKQARDERAETLALDRGFLMPRQQLEEIARRMPAQPAELRDAPDVRDWQIEALGDVLIAALIP